MTEKTEKHGGEHVPFESEAVLIPGVPDEIAKQKANARNEKTNTKDAMMRSRRDRLALLPNS